jgi:hypothetical protein
MAISLDYIFLYEGKQVKMPVLCITLNYLGMKM